TGSVTAPAANAAIHGDVTVSSDSADGGSGVASVLFQAKAPGDTSFSDLGSAVTAAPYRITWPTSGLADGSFDLRVVTTDLAGNTTTSAARTVIVDNTAPAGALTQPADGAAIRGVVTVASGSADGGAGVDSVQFQVEAAGDSSFSDLGQAVTQAPYQTSWTTTGVADGTYELRAVTTDAAGNLTT